MRDWARHTHGSPLYAHLVEVIANDEELMRVINRIAHRPPPNLLFGGVQYLIGADDELARYYLPLTDHPLSPEGAGPAFRSFVLSHEEELIDIGNTRYTQTNECRRCVALLPMVMMSRFDSIHLVDLGTSAGLNLALDLYRYRIGEVEWGPESEVHLTAESRGVTPALGDIDVLSRTGLDLNPIDPSNKDHRRWLDALIWPEHSLRRHRLRAALDMVASVPVQLIAGDALTTLGDVLAGLPPGEAAVVMNSFTLIQFTPEQRDMLETIVEGAREQRPVHRVSMEVLMKQDDWTRLAVDSGDGMKQVGQAHAHGEWIELYARP